MKGLVKSQDYCVKRAIAAPEIIIHMVKISPRRFQTTLVVRTLVLVFQGFSSILDAFILMPHLFYIKNLFDIECT